MTQIILRSKGEDYTVIIDEEDFEKCSKHTWYIHHNKSKNKYCKTHIYDKGKQTTMRLHRFILGLDSSDKRIINHKDCNGLNNQKSNLEICDRNYNNQSINTKKNFGNIYTIKDERYQKKYRTKVIINKKRYSKHFHTREEAQAYLEALKEIAIQETMPFQ